MPAYFWYAAMNFALFLVNVFALGFRHGGWINASAACSAWLAFVYVAVRPAVELRR